MFIGRGIAAEEDAATHTFLTSLPVKNSNIVISKYLQLLMVHIFGYFIVVVSHSIVASIFGITPVAIDFGIIVFLNSIILIYSSIFILCSYRFSYSFAQQSIYIIMLAVFAIFYLSRRVDLSSIVTTNYNFIIIIAVAISLLIALVACFLTIRSLDQK